MNASSDNVPARSTAGGAPDRQSPRVVFVVVVLLLLGTWFAFGVVRHHPFINFDDDTYVYDNAVVKQGVTLHGLAWAFTSVYASNWHPLTWLSHMLDCQWYGLQPAGHHLTSVVLHAASVVVLLFLLWRTTGAFWRSAFVAAVFAVHPLRVESVAWVAERKDVLSGFFFLLTLLAWMAYVRVARSDVRYSRSRSSFSFSFSTFFRKENDYENEKENELTAAGRGECPDPTALGTTTLSLSPSLRYAASLVFFAAALMSKPMAVTLPFVLLLLDYWPLRRIASLHDRVSLRRIVFEKLPFIALAFAACATTLFAQREALKPMALSVRLGNAAIAYVTYLEQMFCPTGLAVYYPHPGAGVPIWKVCAAVGLLLIVSLLAIAARRRQPWILFGWLWYLGMLVPAIGIVQVGSQAHADRYTYLPQIGLYVLVTWSVAEACSRWRFRRVALGAVSVGALGALVLTTRAQVAYWRDSETLWTHTLAVTRGNVIAHDNLGNVLLARGAVDDAIVHFDAALRISPDHVKAHNNLGNALLQKGDLGAAIGHFQQAIALETNYAEAYNNLGVALFRVGRAEEALGQFRKAIEIKPDYAVAHNSLGQALLEKGDADQALASFEKALQLEPTYAEAHYNLGNAWLKMGRAEEAMLHYRQALHLNPGYLDAENNLGYVLLQKGAVDEAIVCFETTLRAERDNVNAHFNLGTALLGQDRLDAAREHFEAVLRIQPGAISAANNLAFILGRQGRLREATVQYENVLQRQPDNLGALANLAWILATCPGNSIRNGPHAVELAQQANRLTGGRDPLVLRTVAAALAETGQFAEAVKIATTAIPLAHGNAGLAEMLRAQLEVYRSGSPFRDDSLVEMPPAAGERRRPL